MNRIQSINEIIMWWYELPADYTGTGDIDYHLQRLSGLYYSYSSDVAKAYLKHLETYIQRRIGIARHELSLYDKMSQNKAEKESIAANEEKYLTEIVAEAQYNEHRLRLSAMSKVMDAMRTRISSLRKEQ